MTTYPAPRARLLPEGLRFPTPPASATGSEGSAARLLPSFRAVLPERAER